FIVFDAHSRAMNARPTHLTPIHARRMLLQRIGSPSTNRDRHPLYFSHHVVSHTWESLTLLLWIPSSFPLPSPFTAPPPPAPFSQKPPPPNPPASPPRNKSPPPAATAPDETAQTPPASPPPT